MGLSIDISGDSLGLFFYAFQLVALVAVSLFVVLPLDGPARIALAFLFASLAIAMAVGLWRKRTGRDGFRHLGRLEDITYDPFADPGQAAKDRWEKAVRRLPDGDDEQD